MYRFSNTFFPSQGLPFGGILADEMGLGKTVEVLALILAHRWPSSSTTTISTTPSVCACGVEEVCYEEGKDVVQCEICFSVQHLKCCNYFQIKGFVCSQCELFPCKTTLIICPQSILPQWEEEIAKHTVQGALKVFHYPGVAKQYVSPRDLASYDIVLASYETLRSELYHATGREFLRKLRHSRRFNSLPSPLTALQWWRICLDEAQMVESKAGKAAEMMQRISAVNRWCVTGTPVIRDLRDLSGLLMFLCVDPYEQSAWYQKLLWEPFLEGRDFPILSLFSKLLWRNSKQDVAAELCLPEQTEHVQWVYLSSVEEYFYRKQRESCMEKMVKLAHYLGSADQALTSLDQRTMNSLLGPLHSLRQACCTPELVRSGYLARDLGKMPLSMANLLHKLSKQAMVEAREALRQLVSTLNGLAGVHLLAGKPDNAIGCYHEAMKVWQEYKDEMDVDCDKLQRIHALENLASLLKEWPGYAPRDFLPKDCSNPEPLLTLKAQELMEEAMELRSEYSAKANTNVRAAIEGLVVAKETVERKGQRSGSAPWWVVMGIWAVEKGKAQDLLDIVNAEHPDHSFISINRFEDMNGFNIFLSLKMEAIESCHEEALNAVNSLVPSPSVEQVEAAAACHLNKDDDNRIGRCDYCKVESTMVHYESQIFSTFGGADNFMVEHGEGVRLPSTFEHIIKSLLAFSRRTGAPRELVSDGQLLVEYIEALQKEYSAMRSLWLSVGERLGMHYELLQASIRLRFATIQELLDGVRLPQAIQAQEIPVRVVEMEGDKAGYRVKLKKCVGQIVYLKSLEKFQHEEEGNTETCPICITAMGREWGVLPCGHSLCVVCMRTLVARYRGHSPLIPCPMCRERCRSEDINYARLGVEPDEAQEFEVVPVRGKYASKILAVVQTLLSIQKKDPTAKSLVFSSWNEVLEQISRCLAENSVVHHLVRGGKNTFQSKLTAFKTSPEVNVLLMLFQSGSKGLNIVEASHVLLVEPQLNVGVELQAVGRVHRMGQTRPTTVHRYIVKHSVEEKLLKLFHGSEGAAPSDTLLGNSTACLTCGQLRDLLLS